MKKFISLELSDKEITDLLELLAEEIEKSYEKEFDAYRARLQAVYDRILLVAEIRK